MGIAFKGRQEASRTIFRATNIPAMLALSVIAMTWVLAEHQNQEIFAQRQRSDVLSAVSVIRAKLEGKINGNIQLMRGLVATLETEPDMDQRRFAALAANLVDQNSQIRNIAGAPGLVVQLMYPMEGNEKAIGLDYTDNNSQREAAMRVRESGRFVLAGPVDLVQGGKAVIGRFPVFTRDQAGAQHFWGLISAVIDVDRLYAESGLLDELPIDVALSGLDATGTEGALFYGNAATFGNDPVTAEVVFPSGSWQIAATPRGGWSTTPDNLLQLRLFLLLAGALIMVPTIMTGRLIRERQDNIRELKQREVELEQLSRRLRLALDTSKVAVWEMNLGERDQFWDPRMNELYGYPADGKPRNYRHWEKRVHPEDLARARLAFAEVMAHGGTYCSQHRIVLDDGQVRHVRALGTVYKDAGDISRLIGVNWDVTEDVSLHEELKRVNALTEARNTELESAKARIEHNSLHDSLTGLPNRRHLDEVLAEHARRFEAGEEKAGLLQINLDRFKQINDTLGHMAGDALLMHVAEALRATIRPGDFLARVGGDEFTVVKRWRWEDDDAGGRTLARLAERIVERMRQPVAYQQHECRISVSIGIAADTDTTADPTRLLVNADIALNRAKERGRNRYQFFNDDLQAEIITTKRTADDILSGIEQSQFLAHYQPQFDAGTLEVIGVEALARWDHPTQGLLAPAAFMKIAEELNVVATIDRIILEHALADLRKWERNGIVIPKISVNVSARRLHDDELIKGLRRMNIRPGTTSFELVESIFLDDNDELVTWNVDQIKELGIDIEIDDFGTGYASIVSLMKLKPRRLKIDRQLIMPITRSAAQRQLVGSIIDIGRSLGIEVLAEGVETMEHARILRSLGCNALQGYAFARPMSAAELIGFVQSRRWRVAS